MHKRDNVLLSESEFDFVNQEKLHIYKNKQTEMLKIIKNPH